MRRDFGENPNAHLPEAEPIDQEKETTLKEALLTELPLASSLEALARIKNASLKFDERTGYRVEMHREIVKRFEELLVTEVQKLHS